LNHFQTYLHGNNWRTGSKSAGEPLALFSFRQLSQSFFLNQLFNSFFNPFTLRGDSWVTSFAKPGKARKRDLIPAIPLDRLKSSAVVVSW
jgi:hypothetical protein